MIVVAAIASVGSHVPRSHGEDSTESPTAQLPDSEFYDAEFAEHVDLRLFGIAWQSLDAKLMTDVALQLREAERVLDRKHPLIESNQSLEFAAKVAAESKDDATLDRLARVAAANGDSEQVDKLQQLSSLAANSRDLRDEPMFSASDVENGALAAFANLVLQIRAAQLAGDKEALEDLKKGVDLLSSLRADKRQRLYGLVDSAMDYLGEQDDFADKLNRLIGPSRDHAGASAPPPSHGVDQPTGYAQVIPKAQVIPNGQGSAGSMRVSYACSGMRYYLSPNGAIVQSHGRLGSILFEPGDVIYALGGLAVNPGTSVDAAINAGYLSGYRNVTVRDRNTGRVLNLFY